jgi:hypothetical protein
MNQVLRQVRPTGKAQIRRGSRNTPNTRWARRGFHPTGGAARQSAAADRPLGENNDLSGILGYWLSAIGHSRQRRARCRDVPFVLRRIGHRPRSPEELLDRSRRGPKKRVVPRLQARLLRVEQPSLLLPGE